MSTRNRRQRDLAWREQLFLDKAQALIRRDGLLALQMSRIAAECEYATGTLYRHFASKEDLLLTLATRNCLARAALFERAARWAGPTRDRLVAIALADLMVAREQPEHFPLALLAWTDMVWGAASAGCRDRAMQAGRTLSALVDGIAVEARRAGDLSGSAALPPAALTFGPWTLSLGTHTLAQQGDFVSAAAIGDPYRLMFKHLHYLLNGYGWRPLFDPADDAALDASLQRLSRAVFDTDWPGPGRSAPLP